MSSPSGILKVLFLFSIIGCIYKGPMNLVMNLLIEKMFLAILDTHRLQTYPVRLYLGFLLTKLLRTRKSYARAFR
jgi:hypothetical protein